MVRKPPTLVAALLLIAAIPAVADVPVTLRGSRESMIRQNRVARESNLEFYRTPAQVRAALALGHLVPLEGNGDYWVKTTVNAVARFEVRQFVEQLSAEYRSSCGEPLVVTSLTRPSTRQPSNAHPLSVHPAGMAIDLRVPQRTTCRRWLEDRLLELEDRGVLDATRERNPPHYHIALFPQAYLAYWESLTPAPTLATLGEEATIVTTGFEPVRIVSGLLPAGEAGVSALEADRRRGGWIDRLLSLPGRLLGLLRT